MAKQYDTRTYKKKLGLKYEPVRFFDRDNAYAWAKGCEKPHWVMHGCDGKYWVVCPADASRLLKKNYEFAD